MKKIVVIIFAVVLSSCSQTKMGYIDVETVMKEYEAMIDLESELLAKQEEMGAELQGLQAAFQAKVQEYYSNSESMSASKKAETEQSLQQEGQMLQGRQQQVSQMLQQENQERSTILIKKIDSVVAVYSKSNGFSMVFGTQGNGTVMYGDDNLNVTTDVVAILNEGYTKE